MSWALAAVASCSLGVSRDPVTVVVVTPDGAGGPPAVTPDPDAAVEGGGAPPDATAREVAGDGGASVGEGGSDGGAAEAGAADGGAQDSGSVRLACDPRVRFTTPVLV